MLRRYCELLRAWDGSGEQPITPIPPTGKEHSFVNSGWGWAVSVIDPVEGWHEGSAYTLLGHGHGLRVGDHVRLKTKGRPVTGRRYQIAEVDYYADPRDMFRALVLWDDEWDDGTQSSS